MPPPSSAGVVAVDVPLRPEELRAAWRPAARRLSLALREPLQGKARVALRISVAGLGVAATITGRVIGARRQPPLWSVEVAPDEGRVRALERLVAVASGEQIDYRPRAPRYLASLPAVVYGTHGPTFMTTFAVSENGCGLAWSGPMPHVGVPMEIRLGAGSQAAKLCGEVCWTAPAARTVGLQFAAGERTAWTRILAEVRRSGAPPA
jgi:hypothetical protein